ncbi:putative alcohol dehydrogenase, partial [Gordonia sputi NBRC 100414]
LWQEGKFPFDELIATYDFTDIASALADFRTGTAIKPVLIPENSRLEDTSV